MKSKKWWVGAVCSKQRLGFIVYASDLVAAISEGNRLAQMVNSEYEIVSIDEITNK
jgi:hypothetical protein